MINIKIKFLIRFSKKCIINIKLNSKLKRDIVCLIRILIDSLPEFIRNSKFLFYLAQIIFGVPSTLFHFRKKYNDGKFKDLSVLYNSRSNYSLKRISKDTDINSFHLRKIKKLFKKHKPNSILDAGCGSGYLINELNKIESNVDFVGIDYQVPFFKSENLKFLGGDILKSLKGLLDNSFQFVICTHVLEHLNAPEDVVRELKRVCSGILIIICPIEKKFNWGLNYHINFYSKNKFFIHFLKDIKSKNNQFLPNYQSFFILGDSMYVEYIKDILE